MMKDQQHPRKELEEDRVQDVAVLQPVDIREKSKDRVIPKK